jgi:hypothetical protein
MSPPRPLHIDIVPSCFFLLPPSRTPLQAPPPHPHPPCSLGEELVAEFKKEKYELDRKDVAVLVDKLKKLGVKHVEVPAPAARAKG